MHTVRDGDTLPSISYGAYGDATQWRLIAEANGVDNPLHLRRGSVALAADAGELMSPAAQASQEHVAGVEVSVSGAQLDPKWRDALLEVKVVDSLTLPDMALIRIADPKGENVDSQPLQLGKEHRDQGRRRWATARPTSIFKGQIAAVEPEFGAKGCTIAVRAYDKSHKLNRERKTRTFQQIVGRRHGPEDRERRRPARRR